MESNIGITKQADSGPKIENEFDKDKYVQNIETLRIYRIQKSLTSEGKYLLVLTDVDVDINMTPNEIETEETLDHLREHFRPIYYVSTEKEIGDITYIVSHVARDAFNPSKTH